jgi:long-subunit acyl-CoA synthetase (AMP-forming)
VPRATALAFLDKTGVRIRELYGSSETGVIAVADPDEAPGTRAARPLRGVEVSVVDDTGGALAAGATGEILVRSPILADGYLGEPGDGRLPLRGGFYPTGDLGHGTPAGTSSWRGGSRSVSTSPG